MQYRSGVNRIVADRVQNCAARRGSGERGGDEQRSEARPGHARIIPGRRMTAPEFASESDARLYTACMLIAVVACIVGIVIENWYWPQDRTSLLGRFIDSESATERFSILAGLVLGHSVVRWLIAFAVAATIVLAVVQIPGVHAASKAAIEAGRLSIGSFDSLLGIATSVLMALFSLLARRLAG